MAPHSYTLETMPPARRERVRAVEFVGSDYRRGNGPAILNDQESRTIETANADFSVLGIQMRGYHDFGMALQDPSAPRVEVAFTWRRGNVF
jgi:hypothetical protein